MTDHSGAILIWQTDPPPAEQIALLRQKLNMHSEITVLNAPSELMFALIPINDDDFSGPSFELTGNEELNGFNAWYYPDGGGGISFPMDEIDGLDEQELMEKVFETLKEKTK